MTILHRVDWPLVVGPELPAPRISRSGATRGVASVLAMAEELSTYPDRMVACRRVVELARDRLGLDRAAVYLEEGGMMRGTWGTGARGQTTEEGALAFPVGGYEETAHQLAEQGVGRWLLLEDAPLIAHSHSGATVLGYGWLALTPIRAAGRRLGMMYSDAGLSRGPFSPPVQVQLAVLCSLFGAILLRHEEPPPTQSDRAKAPEGLHPAVRQVLDLLDGDLTRTTEQLALATGTTPRHLARLFRSHIGESLVSYRNRRRLERFFATTDGRSENLLQAALSAGFGSNAQFHRVFRSLLGTTPGEYLTGHETEEPSEGPK